MKNLKTELGQYTITAAVPEYIYDWFMKKAEEQGRTRSNFLRLILIKYYEDVNEKP